MKLKEKAGHAETFSSAARPYSIQKIHSSPSPLSGWIDIIIIYINLILTNYYFILLYRAGVKLFFNLYFDALAIDQKPHLFVIPTRGRNLALIGSWKILTVVRDENLDFFQKHHIFSQTAVAGGVGC